MEKLAWLASVLVNSLGNPRRPVSIVTLLGREKTHRPTDGEIRMTPEEVAQARSELIRRLEG